VIEDACLGLGVVGGAWLAAAGAFGAVVFAWLDGDFDARLWTHSHFDSAKNVALDRSQLTEKTFKCKECVVVV
jgi:hypothetical protein